MSAYFDVVSHSVADEGGTVDKFIGDGVMAFWGAPLELPDHALRACRGALRSVRRLEAVNATWVARGHAAFRMRIGLNTGEVLVGNVGSAERFSYTAMGDGVNVASRLEEMNKQFGTAICVSDAVVKAAGDAILVRPLRDITVKGREQRFMIYELIGIPGSDDPELRPVGDAAKLSEMTRSASGLFQAGDYPAASNAYRRILDRYPSDEVAKSMLEMPEFAADGAGVR